MKSYLSVIGCLVLLATIIFGGSITAEFTHDFTANPYDAGFEYRGLQYENDLYTESFPPDPPAFSWDDNNGVLECHWNSHNNNAIFAKALPFWIDETSDFEFAFEIELTLVDSHDFHQIAVGFRNLDTINFSRSGNNMGDPDCPLTCKDIVEWGYIPDNEWGTPRIYPIIATSRGDDFISNWVMDTTTLVTGERYRVEQKWNSSTRLFHLNMWVKHEGDWLALQAEDITTPIELPSNRGFQLNAFAINQYKNFADFWDWGTPHNKNILTGNIYNISYSIDLNKTNVRDWHLYDH